jgi:acyl-CoA thioester hydrolase
VDHRITALYLEGSGSNFKGKDCVTSMPNVTSTERFEIPIEVEEKDIDELGHVNNVVYLRWVQEAAVAHWRSGTTREEQDEIAWVVIRHEIDYKRAARMGDAIIARTWVGSSSDLSFERLTEILRANDQSLLARARTLWCPINTKSGRPLRVSDDIRVRFSVSGATPDVKNA